MLKVSHRLLDHRHCHSVTFSNFGHCNFCTRPLSLFVCLSDLCAFHSFLFLLFLLLRPQLFYCCLLDLFSKEFQQHSALSYGSGAHCWASSINSSKPALRNSCSLSHSSAALNRSSLLQRRRHHQHSTYCSLCCSAFPPPFPPLPHIGMLFLACEFLFHFPSFSITSRTHHTLRINSYI